MNKTFNYDNIPPVDTTSGLIKGYAVNGTHIFKGVPYAYAKRFQAPQPVESWEGVRDATAYGFVCPLMTQETPSGELLVPHRYWPMDENCHTLNIWTDTLDSAVKKPVVVWIHGGGYFAGSSIEQEAYDGANMAHNGDVVVVSVNHRLNILGYLDVSPFGEKYANSGNAGQADLVAALRWIHENIASFGGDPENVTLFGQSGGGMKIGALMQTPSADGLFHKAFIMSGVVDDEDPIMPEIQGNGRAIVTAILEELEISEEEVEKLETVPYAQLAAAYEKMRMPLAMQGQYVGCHPLVNDFFLGNPLSHYTEHAKTIPLIVSTVYGEFSFAPLPFNKEEVDEGKVIEILTEKFGEHTSELVQVFKKAYPGHHLLDLLEIDRVFRAPSRKLAMKHASYGKAPAYEYLFALNFPYEHGKSAWHCADIPFIFHNTDIVPICSIPGVTEKLEKEMFNAFMAFARTGDPSTLELEWPACTPDKEVTMIFDKKSRASSEFDRELHELIEKSLPPINLMELLSQDVQH